MAFSLFRTVVAVGTVSALTGCAGTMLDDAQGVDPAGTSFQNALYSGYVDLALAEYDEGDYRDSDYFSRQALAAAGGQAVMPQALEERRLPGDSLGALGDARSRLVAALDANARSGQPTIAAEAQAAFDCWIQEQEENDQPGDIAACREAFETAMARLDPQPMVFEPRSYTVYFATASSNLTGSALEVVRQAADAAEANAGSRVEVVGHTDTVGDPAANARLSGQRAEAVKAALVERGVPTGRIVMSATGEQDLAEPTGDNTDNRLNRRVEITVTK